jgi:hypothetical protein
LDGWLLPGWPSADADAGVLASRNFQTNDRRTTTVAFTDDPGRVAAFTSWKAVRAKWVEAERPAIAARQLFERIHAL